MTGLNSSLHKQAKTLSGGFKRRLTIALAYVTNRQLIILDEPTTSLDIDTRADITASFNELKSLGKTVIFTTHY